MIEIIGFDKCAQNTLQSVEPTGFNRFSRSSGALKRPTILHRPHRHILGIASILVLLLGCGSHAATAVSPTGTALPAATAAAAPATPILTSTAAPGAESCAGGLSDQEFATLNGLEQVDDYPLYTMHYYGSYSAAGAEGARSVDDVDADAPIPEATWACALFAALADVDNMLFGRNFDWKYSPALLVFTDPADGYAAVSMVDIAYLGFGTSKAGRLTELPLTERRALLDAPFLPFDGMNEHGLAVGMAAVPAGTVPRDADKQSIGSLPVIREMLDHARDVDEALGVLRSYNIDWTGGPPLHYLVADASGRAALVEFHQGEMVILANDEPWHQATNFVRALAGDSPGGRCWRYDRISDRLATNGGRLSPQGAIDLLDDVAQANTQWSIVYGISSGEIRVAMGQEYEDVHTFHLRRVGE